MNLLFINGTLYGGGAERVIATLVHNLDASKYRLWICPIKEAGETSKQLEKQGYAVLSPLIGKTRLSNYLRAFRLCRLIKKLNIDIVHSHDLNSLVDGSICRLLLPRVKFIHTFHFGNYPYLPPKNRLMEKSFWRVPDRLISVGKKQMRTIRDTYSIPEARIKTIWNGVDHVESNIDIKFFEKINQKGKMLIGSISTLFEQKGVGFLLDAISKLRTRRDDFVVVVVGGGYLQKALEKKRDELGLHDVVTFTGWVRDASATMLPMFDIVVQSSLWEAMSLLVLETMAAAKPIVATSVGENADVIINGETGLLVEPKNIFAMADAIEKLIADEKLRLNMGDAARRRYESAFTGKIMTEKYENLYESVLKER